MARMIPPVIHAGTNSPGEPRIFEALRDDPDTKDWIVLHSLNLASHRTQVEGEADFVIIVPGKGVLCLEVKAHRYIVREEGLWYYGRDRQKWEARGPFRQAAEAMHSVKARVIHRCPELARTVCWSAVAFPYMEFKETSIEWHPWQVIDQRQYQVHKISKLVLHVLDKAREHLAATPTATWFQPYSTTPTTEQAKAIAAALRSDFEVQESPKAQANRLDEEAQRYTQEQFEALDRMAANKRIAFTGPAGSGKTFLALEAARRSVAEGRRVLFVCYNNLLGQWLQQQLASLDNHVVTRTFHAHLLKIAGLPGRGGDSAFWRTELPAMALERLVDNPREEFLFDEVIVDEAQDLLCSTYIDVLDLSLKGEFRRGRWRLFGDFEKQNIYDGELTLNDIGDERNIAFAHYDLRVNCRNAPRIAAWVELLGGLRPGYASVLRQDNQMDPEIRFYATPSQQQQELIATLQGLYEHGFQGNDIVILSPRAEGCAAEMVNSSPWKDRLRPFGPSLKGYVGYCTIQAFKGLEARVIVVTDVTGIEAAQAQDLFYVALTRALHHVVIISHETVKSEIFRILTGRKGS